MIGESYTLKQVAKYLQLSIWTVYALLQRGAIPGAFKVGGSWRVDAKQFHAFIKAGGNK